MVAAALCVACGGSDGGGPVRPEDPPPNDSGPPGDVQLITLTVAVTVGADDAAVAQALGWTDGAVERALVTVRRVGSTREDSVLTDVGGRTVVRDLLEGNYTISASRLLDDDERQRLPSADAEVSVLGGGLTTQLTPPAEERDLSLTAGRRGSILISEYAYAGIFPVGGSSYSFSGYLEIYNNADSTVYLDGLIVGAGWSRVINAGLWPCTDFDFLRLDPDGLWSGLLYQFPGTGRSYPLRPGETAVLATDGIDHSELIDGGLDLSGADFEFIGRNDVDNPAVPNLVSVGPQVDQGRRGLIHHSTQGVPLIAKDIDLDSLPRQSIQEPQELDFVRIPRSALIDIGHFIWFGGLPVCDRAVDPSLDGAASRLSVDHTLSAQRRVLTSAANGKPSLQDTNTSSRDFRVAPRSPGTIRD